MVVLVVLRTYQTFCGASRTYVRVPAVFVATAGGRSSGDVFAFATQLTGAGKAEETGDDADDAKSAMLPSSLAGRTCQQF